MTQNELMHYGVKGMRWGKRKSFVGPVQPVKTRVHNKLPSQNNLNSIKSISDNSRLGVDAIRNTSNQTHRNKKGSTGREQARSMSDAELKQKVSRLNLEQQYANLSAHNVSKGRVTMENTLSIAGGVLATTSSVLGIALAVKQLTGK